MGVLRVKYFCLACRCRYFLSPIVELRNTLFWNGWIKVQWHLELDKTRADPRVSLDFIQRKIHEKFHLFSFSLFLSTFKYSQIFLVLIYIREAEYMRMVDQFHNGDLSFHFHQHGFRQFFSINDLDRHLLAQHTVDPKLDQSWNKHGDQFDYFLSI